MESCPLPLKLWRNVPHKRKWHRGHQRGLLLLLFIWKVLFCAIGEVIFSSRWNQSSHSGFHKPCREAQSGVNEGWDREHVAGILNQCAALSWPRHSSVAIAAGGQSVCGYPWVLQRYLNFLPCVVGVHCCFRCALWVVKLDWKNLTGIELWYGTSRGEMGKSSYSPKL